MRCCRCSRSLLLSLAILALSSPAFAQTTDLRAQDEVFYQIFTRSFRDSNGDHIGDLRGIQQGLDYLQKLGVTSLLLTPINPSPFYHNYFASSFEGVDPAYGDARALQDLIKAVHARHMKLYLDEEIQYVVPEHVWWKESAGQPSSKYSSYVLYNGPGNTQPESSVYNLTETLTWNGTKVGLASVNLLAPAVKQYFQDLFVSLVDPNHDGRFDDGVDGFRLDHMMDDLDNKGKEKNLFADFWAPIFGKVRAVNPRVLIIGEQFDWGLGIDFLTRGGVDMVFDFPILRAVGSWQPKAIAEAANATLAQTPAGKGQLVFIENHDVSRFATMMAGDLRKEKIGAALLVMLKGTPLIYYGQEIGMKGKHSESWASDANDIPDREAFRWSSMVEGPNAAVWYKGDYPWWRGRYAQDHDGISVEEQERDPNSLLSFYRQMLTLRRTHPEVQHGGQQILTTDQKDVLALARSSADRTTVLLVNFSGQPVTATVTWPAALKEQAPTVSLPALGIKLVSNHE